jgi:stage V sporulation protein D (sporulation-specific penicillin-binding protein)
MILQKRLLVMILLITFLFMVVVLRLGFLQLIDGKWLQAKALDEWTRDVPISAKRGLIFDSTGSAIAVNINTYDVYVRPKNIANPKNVAKILSENLSIDFKTIYQKVLDNTKSEVLIKLQVDNDTISKIRKSNEKGIVFAENSKRYYPYGDLFTQVLGYTTIDSNGQSGLEAYYNDLLKGTNGYALTQADVQGIEIDNTLQMYVPSIEGSKIVTTLDAKIQLMLENAMNKIMLEQKSKSVTGIVMNPKTGAILAMGSKPSFDLNNIPRNDVNTLMQTSKNEAIVDVYEPGSTFKILTSAISLDEGTVKTTDRFYDPGYRIVDGQKIKCWKSVGHGSESFTDGFCNSCNSVFIDCALKLGTERFYSCLNKLGIGKKTNIEYSGESSGILMDADSVKNVDLARIGFGQAVAVTPIQLITAISACVNGGNLMKPYLVDSITSKDGIIIEKNEPTCVRKVIKSEVSDTIKMFLEEAVSRGHGYDTFIEGYRVGGKTGTTQKYENGRIANKYISSFAGIFPSNDPDYIILIAVNEPNNGAYYGSIVASPYAKEVIKGIIDYKHYLPHSKVIGGDKMVVMPNLVGLSLVEATNKLISIGLNYEIGGEGDFIKEQFPPAGTEILSTSTVQINTN